MSHSHSGATPQPTLRPAAQVMDLDRLGSLFQSRLSFVRSSMRRMMNEQWRIQRTCFDLDPRQLANLMDRGMLTNHLLRCKLAFFGAGKFDPKSSRWVRITLFQSAPLVSEIGTPESICSTE